jgi:hypothetical protein
VLREDELSVELDVELPGLAGDELHGLVRSLFDDGRETRSLGTVVSGVAIPNDDAHGPNLPRR